MKDNIQVLALMDEILRLKALFELRMKLLDIKIETKDCDIYIAANEMLNQMEKQIWNYLENKKEDE